ncbi:MAG: 2-succinyl-5-enolpyruvyl-6-hydroxy-3-cyclohexene-1-carboxylic-acid synthase [Cytophagales bacterium]|nr:2-succinyl-5-enolpyruvyl-6-hydroxy-3-cyclohexene-1-carboxylic-acid synthase [Cytophagales bacterium]
MMHQTVFDTSEIFRLLGVEQVIICPGSRNAPLTISFVQNLGIKKVSVVDERSAGFIAIGIAQATGKPVVVCCTSGSAVLNFAPACAEAFYQEVPVIFLSADRPPEWIDQGDGQTIRQSNVLSPHVKANYDLPVDLSHTDAQWEYQRKLNDAVNTANSGVKGPVHVNIPFREPFYPKDLDQYQFSEKLPVRTVLEGTATPLDSQERSEVFRDWMQYSKRLFVLGQDEYDEKFLYALNKISLSHHIPIVADVISNANNLKGIITKQDLFLADPAVAESLKPDLVITFGKTLISKNLKIALRKDLDHWTIGSHRPLDTFRNLRKVISWNPVAFLELVETTGPQPAEYQVLWQSVEKATDLHLQGAVNAQSFSEFWVFKELMAKIPARSHVHLSNSMAVRYANFLAPKQKHITFHCNRGTSGIDGPVSTAVGFASTSDQMNILITGDLSALYDRNAFLNDLSPNLKIIVSNNCGGGIFDLIPGPKVLAAQDRKQYFETRHDLSFARFADEIQFDYFLINDKIGLQSQLESFLKSKKNGLMEIQTKAEINGEVYRKVKGYLKEKSPFGDS